MCNTKDIQIIVPIENLVFTPNTCAIVINELIKCLVYGKSQIPYPFNCLTGVVNNKKGSSDSEKPLNFTIEKHFREVSSAFTNLEGIMNEILKEFNFIDNTITEIVFLFGATLVSIKEVYIIKIPILAKDHLENNHCLAAHKNKHKVLR